MELSSVIDQVLLDVNFRNNTFFKNLHEGEFDKEDFIETQIQFFFAVIFFNRPMGALAAKIPTANLRLEILRNIWEEHGEGNLGNAHSETFVAFLERLGGVTIEDIQGRALWPEVRAFNTCLTGACVQDDYMVAVPMMGIIERMFCEISTIIGQGILKRKWLSEEKLIHYNLHAELDIKHSQDFFDVVAESWEKSDENKYYIEQGLRLGAAIFNNLYTGLYEGRARRMMRTVNVPHSRAEGVL